MSDFRARDADRDRAVEVIEAAYVDGQLGDADRELRVSRALSAQTLDELAGLTRDLQVHPAADVVRQVAVPVQRPAGSRRWVAGAVAAGVGVLALGLGSAVLVVPGGSDSATSTTVEAPVVSEEPVTRESEAASFEMTPAAVRRFLRAYESEFGTLDAYEVGFYPARVGVQVPVRGARPRSERWSYDGTWRQDTAASAVRGPGGVVDLGAVDVARLFANIERARKTLRVPRGELTHVLVNDRSEVPTVNIYIASSTDESGYLKTTLGGDVLRSFPHEP